MGSRQGYRKDEDCRKDQVLKKQNFFPPVVNSFEIKSASEMIDITREHELKTQ